MPKKKKKISASNMAIERHMLNRDLKQLNTTMKSSLKEMTALLKKIQKQHEKIEMEAEKSLVREMREKLKTKSNKRT